jgi:hypothetical protein
MFKYTEKDSMVVIPSTVSCVTGFNDLIQFFEAHSGKETRVVKEQLTHVLDYFLTDQLMNRRYGICFRSKP